MPATSTKAFRCESCGAALPVDQPTCDYCGSSHQLPAYQPAAPAVGPPVSGPPVAAPLVSPRRLAVLIAVAAAAATAVWLVMR